MKRIIFYDLDGTLIDTRKDIVLAVQHMTDAMGRERLSAGEIYDYVGTGLRHLVSGCLKTDDPREIERGASIYRQYYADHMLDHSALYPGAELVLKFFKGRMQYVVTNKPNPFSEDMLRALGVMPYLAGVIAGNSGYPRKPDPGALLAMAQKDAIPVEEVLMIGDSLFDLETARNAGVENVMISHGFTSADRLKSNTPDWLVHHFEELLKLAEQQGW